MSSESNLFRAEVLDSDAKRAFGDVLLVYPVSNYFIVLLALGLAATLCIFAGVGKYTRHASVAGVLEPSQGVVKLYASQSGVLKSLRVQEGQAVRKGEILLVFESEHSSANGQVVEEEMVNRLHEQLATMRNEFGVAPLTVNSACS